MTTERTAVRKSRTWMTLVVNLMMAALVILLPRSNKFLSREQLAEIQIGMTLAEAQARLGLGRDSTDFYMGLGIFSTSSGELRFGTRDPWDPTLVVPIDSSETLRLVQQSAGVGQIWIGRDHLLWVHTDDNNRVRRAVLLPYREEGGGIASWLKHYYYLWFSDPAPVMPAAPMPAPAPSQPES